MMTRSPETLAGSCAALALAFLLAGGGCASAPGDPGATAATESPSPDGGGPTAAAAGAGEQELVPPGHGTLRQDDFTVSLREGPLLIKVTPLEEGLIRLAAPDTYRRLHSLASSRSLEIAQRAGEENSSLFLVSFFSYEPDVAFRPEDLRLVQQGRIMRALAVLPVSAGWSRQRLGQQETQAGLFAFDPRLDLSHPVTVEYDIQRSDEWSSIIQKVEIERAKVRSRAGT